MSKLVEILYEILLEDKVSDLKAQFVDSKKLSQPIFDRLVAADPTPAKRYIIWIVSRFYNEVIKPNIDKETGKVKPEGAAQQKRFFEDLYKITDGLANYNRGEYRPKFEHNDIFKYSTEAFIRDAYKVEQGLSAADKAKGVQKNEKYPEFKIGEVEGFTVYKLPQGRLDLKSVSCDLGSGTNWCTSKHNQNYYDSYVKKDPLFIFIKGNEKYQFHLHDNMFMDKEDHPMQKSELQQHFFDFIKNKEGRFRGQEDLKKYKIGEFTTEAGTFPLYQVANKMYTTVGGQNIFYDTEIGGGQGFKQQDGKTLKLKASLQHPYMDLIKYVYSKLDAQEKGKFPGIYRMLLQLDLEGETLPTLSSLNVSGTDLTSLPDGLSIEGDLDLSGSKIKKLPKNLKVGGQIIDYKGDIIKK